MSQEIWLVFGLGALILIPVLVLTTLNVMNTRRGRNAHGRLAEEGGYRSLHDAPNVFSRIYGGKKYQRPFAFRVVANARRSSELGGGSFISPKYRLQVVAPLNASRLVGLTFTRKSGLRSMPEFFDEIWTVKPSADPLTYNQKKALMTFATTKPHTVGLFGMRKKMRCVNIVEREQIDLPADVFPEASQFVVYDHPNGLAELEEFKQIAADVMVLVRSLETASPKASVPASARPLRTTAVRLQGRTVSTSPVV